MNERGDLLSRTIDVYNKESEGYLRQWSKRPYRPPALLVEWQHLLPRRARLLDLGCGPAQDARYLRRKGYHSVGLDLTWPLLTHAKGRSRHIPLVYADFRRLPFKPESFHGIWAAASLIHVTGAGVRRVLRNLAKLVVPGGVMAATFVHGRESGCLEQGWLPGRYISRWLKADLQATVEQAGWSIISLRTVTNRERKGRWLNLLAQRPGQGQG